ncbi:RDD family protein [Actinacidiphila yanglinensis]|uniref:RDD family protein n=1 Tax=Actinacidiphila yanglinensis TaxID=310779 RepID=A0A1H5V846_9ACTN|nr:RDD family protein [Actinacidiphila yanglinensis]SEF83555.1 RDD family protein [Actinacidiphila yanglinensis]
MSRTRPGRSSGTARVTDRAFWLAALAGAVAASFVHQVLLSSAVRAGIGKLPTGLRVVRAGDGGRAGFGRTMGRWGAGFSWGLVIVPLHAAANSDVQQADLVGLRVVRRPTSR